MSRASRVMIDRPPLVRLDEHGEWSGLWPAKWVSDGTHFDETPRVVAYRLRFRVDVAQTIRVHVSADERYELFLDGHRVGRGPERGDRLNWFFETYDLDLPAGEHVLVARTWWLGPHGPSPFAQMTVRHAFLLAPDDEAHAELLTTGTAAWECKRLDGYEWLPAGQAWGCGAKVRVVGERFPWGFERGERDGWVPATPIVVAHDAVANDRPHEWKLRPALLPPMREESGHVGIVRHVADAADFPFHDNPYVPQPPVLATEHLVEEGHAWNALVRGETPPREGITIPPNTARRIIIDLDAYLCGYPDLVTSGGRGALVRVSWAESLYDRFPEPGKREWIGAMPKGNRDEVEGKFFHGVTDEFLPDGGSERGFTNLWWQAGRYVQVLIRTEGDPLVVHDLSLRVTGYPFEFTHTFEASDDRLAAVSELAIGAMRAGSHETYTDSPYYEQIQYVGDTRLECLATYASCPDDRLPRKAVELLDASRGPDGLVNSRYPSRVTQHTWGFNLWWVAMAHDFMMWRDDAEFVRARVPGVRAAIDAALRSVTADGIVAVPRKPNFRFCDWGVGWRGGHPPTAGDQSALFTWQLAHVLNLAAEIEDHAGEPELAARNRRRAGELALAADAAFWDESRGLYADDSAKTSWSEHAQILALLALADDGIAALRATREPRLATTLFDTPGLHRATIYFCHYLFEVCHRLGRGDVLLDRMGLWFDLLPLGLRALPEMPEPTRSDCHAWGAHVLYHAFATILGVRPAAPGFGRATVAPVLGPLTWAKGTMPHPRGEIRVDLRKAGDGGIEGTVELPEGVEAEPLPPGAGRVRILRPS